MGKSVNINRSGCLDADMQEPAVTRQAVHSRAPGNREYNWTARVTFVPFESEAQRSLAYRQWVRIFLRGKEKELKPKTASEKMVEVLIGICKLEYDSEDYGF